MTNFFKSRTTVILISILWGLGLATLFNMSCKSGQKCESVDFIGPPKELLSKSWTYDESMSKCYNVMPKIVECSQK